MTAAARPASSSPGYKCDPNPTGTPANVDKCSKTTCGDGAKEGTEQCDDHNTTPFDGCSPSCTNEPKCGYDTNNKYGCTAQCGDGMIFGGEQCDDGNTIDGDGCSSKCIVEGGYTCTPTLPALPSPLALPIIYRDFKPSHNPASTGSGYAVNVMTDAAPQFEIDPGTGGRTPGIVLPALGTDGKPAYNTAFTSGGVAGYSLNGANPASGTAQFTTPAQIGTGVPHLVHEHHRRERPDRQLPDREHAPARRPTGQVVPVLQHGVLPD